MEAKVENAAVAACAKSRRAWWRWRALDGAVRRDVPVDAQLRAGCGCDRGVALAMREELPKSCMMLPKLVDGGICVAKQMVFGLQSRHTARNQLGEAQASYQRLVNEDILIEALYHQVALTPKPLHAAEDVRFALLFELKRANALKCCTEPAVAYRSPSSLSHVKYARLSRLFELINMLTLLQMRKRATIDLPGQEHNRMR